MSKKPDLTPDQQAYVDDLRAAELKATEAGEYLAKVKRQCVHAMPPLTDKMKVELRKHSYESWKYDRASCHLCGKDFGWRCPDSPDSACHYFTTRDGKVKLIDGTEIDPPEGHDVDHETEDSCMFCFSPQERK